jgi:subtilisin family serine protease
VPAEATNVLAIGAVKPDETYATFSSIGPSFDGRVKPDIMAQGQAAVVSNTSGTIVTANGTSFSGPIMAGMITSFWSAVPTLTATQVVQFVKQSADRYTAPTNLFGYGIPDFQLALTNALGNEVFDNENIVLYPNPVQDSVTIHLPSNQSAELYFYNSLGQMINQFHISNSETSISLEKLTSGIYFYELSLKNKTQKGKLLKL